MLFLFCSLSLSAQEMSFSLKEAQDYAIKNNASAKNADLDLKKAKQEVKHITSIGLPQINATAGYSYFVDIPTQVAPANAFDPNAPEDVLVPLQFGTDHNANAGITATQLIFDGTYIVGLQASKLYVKLSENTLKKSEIEVKDQVAQAYYMALVAEENKIVLEKNLENLSAIVSELKSLFEQGMVEQEQYEQMELTRSITENSFEQAKNLHNTSLQLLKFQLGIDVDKEITLKDDLESMASTLDPNVLSKEINVSNHIDYQIISAQEGMMKLNVRKEKFTKLPSIGASFTHSQNAFSNELSFPDWYPTTIVGAQLRLPIFDSFGQRAKIKQATFDLEKVSNNRSFLEQSLKLQANTARANYTTSFARKENEKKNMELAKRIYDKTLLKQKEGMSTSMEVTQANNQYLSSQGNYFRSLFELLKAKTELDKALGNY